MSVIMREAMDRWNEMRDDFELFRHAQYERAAADCKGELLNALGREEGIEPYSLFLGTTARAAKYASEELREWWAQDGNSRMTVEAFERQWLTAREDPNTGPLWMGWPR